MTQTSPEFVRSYSYDTLSRPASTLIEISGIAYTSAVSYDGISRVSVIHYPSGFAVRNVYGAHGYLVRVEQADAASLSYWRLMDVNAAGQVLHEIRDNGITVERDYGTTRGRLERIMTGANGSIQDLEYDYDYLGKV